MSASSLSRSFLPARIVLFGALTFLLACSGDTFNSPTRLAQPAVAEMLGAKEDGTLATRADSVRAVRRLARAIAVGLADDSARLTLHEAFRRSSIKEGKLNLRKFLRARGSNLRAKLETANRLPAGSLETALGMLEDLELYIPIPTDRERWVGGKDVLVSGFIDTEDEIAAAGGTVVAYGVDGRERAIAYTAPSSAPVVVLTTAESSSGPDGESRAPAAPSPGTAGGEQSSFCIGCPLPAPLPEPCASSSTGTTLYVCHVTIPNVSGYEGALRGSPEVSILLFSVLADGTGTQIIGCLNEDLAYPSYYDQNIDDHYLATGYGRIGTKAAIDAAHAAGRAVHMLVWEDDNGSKCNFQTSSTAKRDILNFLGYGGVAVSIGWIICDNQCGGQPPDAVVIVGLAAAALRDWALGADDDPIGAATLPPGADPHTSPRKILFKSSQTGSTVDHGTIWFATR